MTTANTSRDLEDVLVDLSIIRQIPTNHKLNVSTKTYVHSDSVINSSIGRWWHKETGNTTIDYINKTIDSAIAVCKKNPHWLNMIADKINSISNALANLEKVYERENKIEIVGRINYIKERIDKDRFLRGFQELDICDIPSSKPIPISTVQSMPQPHCTNCSRETPPPAKSISPPNPDTKPIVTSNIPSDKSKNNT